MTNYREILRLNSLGINNSRIALSVGCTRQTVISVLNKAKQKNLTYAQAISLSDRELAAGIQEGGLERANYRMPDYEKVHKELAKSSVTLSLLWVEYCQECKRNGEIAYQSTQFNKYYADYARKVGATMHIERKPGESMEVDWAGGTAPVINQDTGEVMNAYVFVSALSYSSYAYAEAFWTMQSENWIIAHVHAYEFYGGVCRLLIPDNLKAGIVKNTKAETVVNKTYQEMAEHYGTAVLPARVESPNDKPHAEGAVKAAQTWILAAVRNMTFFSLQELNFAIREKLTEFNARPFQKLQGSRLSKYLEEKPFFLPLPKYPFENPEWRSAKVQKDYHVKSGLHYYSVPYEFIGKQVDIRITRNVVEIFFEHMRIASHQKTDAYAGKYVTQNDHMPPSHQKYGEWNADRFLNWAKKIGPSTVSFVEFFLASCRVEQQAYKTCNALLHLSTRYSVQRLEQACHRALTFAPRPSYKAVDSILRSGLDQLTADEKEKEKKSDPVQQHGFLRGPGYYGGDKNAE